MPQTACSSLAAREQSSCRWRTPPWQPVSRWPWQWPCHQAVEAAEKIGARETWLIHLTHEVDHDEVEATLPSGIRLAYDGLQLEV